MFLGEKIYNISKSESLHMLQKKNNSLEQSLRVLDHNTGVCITYELFPLSVRNVYVFNFVVLTNSPGIRRKNIVIHHSFFIKFNIFSVVSCSKYCG